MNANKSQQYAVGIDFGTLSGRAVVVRVSDGEELGSAVHEYSHGVIETSLPGTQVRLGPNWALQSPTDWVDVLRRAVPKALALSGVDPADVIGVGTDFTACTVLPTTADGTPLCDLAEFAERPHAWPKLWKHHAAQPHADLINKLAEDRGEPWLARYGGRISSEWEFAKGLQLLQEDPQVYARTDRWIEAADWIIWQLTGTESRNVCTAGYKGIRTEDGYPSRDYLIALDPAFADFTDKLADELLPLGALAGRLSPQAAEWTGLPAGIAVAAGNVDAHVTAAAADATRPGQMVAIMGTSTCHVMSSDQLGEVPGMCGVVDGGIIDGLWGYEAGQSAVGDIFGWFVDNCVPPAYVAEADRRGISVHTYLEELAAEQPVGAHGLIALDWHNGNRSDPGRPRSVRRPGRADAGDPSRGRLPRADRGHRLRDPADRRGLRGAGGRGRGVHRRRRPAEEPAADADLLRRAAPPDLRGRLRTGPGASVRPSMQPLPPAPIRTCRRQRRRWDAGSSPPTGRTATGPTATTCCTPSTGNSTTTSPVRRTAATAYCTGSTHSRTR